MTLKKKIKMSNEEIDVEVIDVIVKNEAELQKIRGNLEGISEFAEKFRGRYEIRMKIDKNLSNYLSQIDIPFPLPAEKELHLNLMKVLGFFSYISIFVLLFSLII
jgi:hypothetical protein